MSVSPTTGFIFQCGCTFGATQTAGWIHCNIHNTTGPKCPWCNAKPGVVWLIDTRSVVYYYLILSYPRNVPHLSCVQCVQDVLMFAAYLLVAWRQWKRIDGQHAVMDASAVGNLLVNHSRSIDAEAMVEDGQRRERFYDVKAIAKRMWIPLAVFTVYDIALGLAFYVGTSYPYFMFWER